MVVRWISPQDPPPFPVVLGVHAAVAMNPNAPGFTFNAGASAATHPARAFALSSCCIHTAFTPYFPCCAGAFTPGANLQQGAYGYNPQGGYGQPGQPQQGGYQQQGGYPQQGGY